MRTPAEPFAGRPTRAEIRLGALRRNFCRARDLAGRGVKIMAVVKAEAYGHGMIRVARELLSEGADYLGVALVEEALSLREAGFDAPILVFGSPPDEALPLFPRFNIDLALVSASKARAAFEAASALGKSIRVHLKIDTGMSRLGAPWNGLEALADELSGLLGRGGPGLEIVGAFSHLATADCDLDIAREQASRFRSALRVLKLRGIEPPIVHLENSAGLVSLPDERFDMVRPGILVYGYEPSPWKKVGVEPVMRLVSQISYLKELRSGEAVSYGHTWRALQDTTIATLPLGYADGYNRALSNRAQVLIGGVERPVAGRICMDQTMVDLGPASQAQEGDEALIFGSRDGESLPGESLCELLGTIPYELTCMVSARVPRVYVED